MTTTLPKPKPSRWRRLLFGVVWFTIICSFLLALAASPPVVAYAWRQARGTEYERPVVRWYLFVYGDRVERALALGRIHEGQPVEEVIEKYGPFRVNSHERYTELKEPGNYIMAFEGYRIVARDGRLVGAGWWTCTGSAEFFNALSSDEWKTCNEAIYEGRWQRRIQSLAPRMAVTGVIGYVHPVPPAEPDPPADPNNE